MAQAACGHQEAVTKRAQMHSNYDKSGEAHYDVISASSKAFGPATLVAVLPARMVEGEKIPNSRHFGL